MVYLHVSTPLTLRLLCDCDNMEFLNFHSVSFKFNVSSTKFIIRQYKFNQSSDQRQWLNQNSMNYVRCLSNPNVQQRRSAQPFRVPIENFELLFTMWIFFLSKLRGYCKQGRKGGRQWNDNWLKMHERVI